MLGLRESKCGSFLEVCLTVFDGWAMLRSEVTVGRAGGWGGLRRGMGRFREWFEGRSVEDITPFSEDVPMGVSKRSSTSHLSKGVVTDLKF
jgi:hypothetical protein